MTTAPAEAFWVSEPGVGEIRPVTLPPHRAEQVLVRTLFSGISRGTESLVFRGDVPPSEYQRMRAPFQEGDFPAPVKYGYASVGVVEIGPAHLEGRHVFCLYPHQTRYVVPAQAVTLLPDSLPPRRAILAANLETAINALWDARPQLGDRISVVGGGVVGLLVGWLAAQVPGCTVQLIDVNSARATIAESLGLHFTLPADAVDEQDLLLHTSASAAGLATALRLAAFEASVIEMSWYGAAEISLPLGSAFHSQRLTLRSSQVGHVATSQRARWDYARRMALALKLLDNPLVDALITDESVFTALPDVMTTLATGGNAHTLCHCIRYT